MRGVSDPGITYRNQPITLPDRVVSGFVSNSWGLVDKKMCVRLCNTNRVSYLNQLLMIDENNSITEPFDRLHIMTYKHNGCLVMLQLIKIIEAFSLEVRITHREHFVNQKDISLRPGRNRESQAHLHAAGVVLQLLIHEGFELGEIDDIVVHFIHFGRTEAAERAAQVDVLAARQFGVEADAELDEWNEPAFDTDCSIGRLINFGKNLQERTFAASVASDDTEELALLDVEGDVVKRVLHLVCRPTAFAEARKDRLDRALFFMRQPEALTDMVDADRNFIAHLRLPLQISVIVSGNTRQPPRR